MNVLSNLSISTTPAAAPRGGSTDVDTGSADRSDFAILMKDVPTQKSPAKAGKPEAGADTDSATPAITQQQDAPVGVAIKGKKAVVNTTPERKAKKGEVDGAGEAVAGTAQAAIAQPLPKEAPLASKVSAVDTKVGDGKTSGKALAGTQHAVGGQSKIIVIGKNESEKISISVKNPSATEGGKAENAPVAGDASKAQDGLPDIATGRPHAQKPLKIIASTPVSNGTAEAPVTSAATATAPSVPVMPGEATALLRMLTEARPARSADAKSGSNAVTTPAPLAVIVSTPASAVVPVDGRAEAVQPVLVSVAGAAAAEAKPASKSGVPATLAALRDDVATDGAMLKPIVTDGASDRRDTRSDRHNDATVPVIDGAGIAEITPSTPSAQNSATLASPAAGIAVSTDVGAALGQQAIDINTGGQWIDDISSQIASVSRAQGHGSFTFDSGSLGKMKVELTPGVNGTDIRMTVDNEAAEVALTSDRSRLVQDAQLAAVRIGEVRVDRVANVGDARAGDMGNGQGGGQSGSQNSANGGGSSGQSSMQSSLNQGSGQGNGQSARQAAEAAFGQNGRSGGSHPKQDAHRAVSSDSIRGEVAARAVDQNGPRARYA